MSTHEASIDELKKLATQMIRGRKYSELTNNERLILEGVRTSIERLTRRDTESR